MITVNASRREPICLRHQGENDAMRVAFPLSAFEADWPGGTPLLLVQRPRSSRDAEAYPVALSVDGHTAYWTVRASDIEYSGYGKAQIQWRVEDVLVKSCIYDTVCVPSLHAGAEPPDEPSKRWFDAIQAQIGDLSKLTTKAKDNLVAAINEAARSGGGSGGAGTIDMRVADGYIQYSNDGGATWENLIAIADLKGADGKDGTNGTDGTDGHTPVITASKSGKVTTIKVDGEAVATVNDGADGTDGADASLGITGAAAGKIPKIKAVDAAGKPTEWEAAAMPESGPTDAQVSSAVNTWLTEHPEATTTVQDGAVTPQKTSFLEREFASIMDLGEYKKTFLYSIKNDGSYYIHAWNANYNFKADITGLTKIVIRATAAYINYVFFAEAPTGATGQAVVGHGGTFAGQTKLHETDANEPTAQTVEINVPDNAVWLMVDFGYAQPTELMIGKPIDLWKFGGQIDKTVNGADIVDETVDTQKLADGAVTTEKLANQSVSTDKLAGYSTVRRDVPWELFLDGYGTSAGKTVESPACAIYSMKFEAGKTYCILNLPSPNNTNEFVADPTDINNFGSYFSYYPSLPDVAANLAAGKDRLYGYKKAANIQQALLKAESDGYVETAITGQALSQPPVCFTVKQDWYVLRASTKPDAGKRVNNYYVAELQMTGISALGNGMNGQLWYVYKKDLGNGYASDKGYLQQIFVSKTANAENERAYAAMSRDVPRDRTLNIHFIGDSITYAASNAGLQNAFRKYVPMNLRAETMALCQSGVSVTTGSGSFDWNGKQNTDTAYDAAMSGYSGLAQKLAEYKTNLSLAAWADAVDIVVVELGTNDHWDQAALGVPTNLTEDTNFYGAVEKTLTLLEDTFPHAQILWMLPFKNQNWKTSTIKLVDYLIALKILCQMHTRCWVLDLFDKWFLNYDDTDLRNKFFIDNVHITGNAHKCVAESMIDKIRQIISVCGLRQIETVRVTNANDSVYGSANA